MLATRLWAAPFPALCEYMSASQVRGGLHPSSFQSSLSLEHYKSELCTNTTTIFSKHSNLYLCLLFSSRSAAVATLCLVSLEATIRCITASSSGTCSASMNFTIPSLHYSRVGNINTVLLTRKRTYVSTLQLWILCCLPTKKECSINKREFCNLTTFRRKTQG